MRAPAAGLAIAGRIVLAQGVAAIALGLLAFAALAAGTSTDGDAAALGAIGLTIGASVLVPFGSVVVALAWSGLAHGSPGRIAGTAAAGLLGSVFLIPLAGSATGLVVLAGLVVADVMALGVAANEVRRSMAEGGVSALRRGAASALLRVVSAFSIGGAVVFAGLAALAASGAPGFVGGTGAAASGAAIVAALLAFGVAEGAIAVHADRSVGWRAPLAGGVLSIVGAALAWAVSGRAGIEVIVALAVGVVVIVLGFAPAVAATHDKGAAPTTLSR